MPKKELLDELNQSINDLTSMVEPGISGHDLDIVFDAINVLGMAKKEIIRLRALTSPAATAPPSDKENPT